LISIDQDKITIKTNGTLEEYPIGSPQAFSILSKLWLRSGWDAKYVYSFSWLGRPIIQLPEDLVRIQEVIFAVQPDVIIETGVAHGGSLVFYASLCKAMGRGRVIGVDIEIRPHNRRAIESHFLHEYITLVEGDSTAQNVVKEVSSHVKRTDTVLVCLDSCHTKNHVLKELNCYGPLVTKDSYIVAMDGIMEELVGAPRTNPDWSWNNPKQAAIDFAGGHPEFELADPAFAFNEGEITERVTYWPGAWLRRKS
jgi:cephalosporin hydroxylase